VVCASPDGRAPDERLRAEWQIAAVVAARAAKAWGSIPALGERLLEQLTSTDPGWRELLADWVRAVAQSDWSYRRPEPAAMARGFVLPTCRAPSLGRIAVAIDTSGSISQHESEQFASALGALLSAYPECSVRLIYADTRVQLVDEIGSADPLPTRIPAGGGTDLRAPHRWLEESGEAAEVAGLIYLTDLYGPLPEQPPEYPVLYVCPRDHGECPPWATIAVLEDQR